jgi:hypothetical protein
MPAPDGPDPRTPKLEAQLRALDPADELAYRWAYREHSPHCRRDPAWRARMVEIQAQLDDHGHARALTRAREINASLTGSPKPSTAP